MKRTTTTSAAAPAAATSTTKPPKLRQKNGKKKFVQRMKSWLTIGFPLGILAFALFLSYSSGSKKPSVSWPTDAYAHKVKGDQLYMKKQYPSATKAYEAAYELLEREGDPTLNRYAAITANNIANMKKISNKMSEALEWYKIGTKKDETHFETHYNYANTLLSLQKNVQAEIYFRIALKLRPKDAKTMMGLAGVLRQGGNTDEAKEMLLEATRLEPKNADIIANLGLQYLAEKDVENGVKQLQKASDMGHEGAKTQLTRLLQALQRVRQDIQEE